MIFEQGAMASPIGMQWACVSPIISPIFKLLNVILDQLMDCNVIIHHYTHIIRVHKLGQNYL